MNKLLHRLGFLVSTLVGVASVALTVPQLAHADTLSARPSVPLVPTVDEGANGTQLPDHKMLTMGITTGVYAALYTYEYAAWYARGADSPTLQFHDEGWFGMDTYAGGADKLGHMWGNYTLTRGVSGILEWGGWSKTASLATSASLAAGFFLVTEIKDGYKPQYGFSWQDLVFNLAGNTLGVAMELSPRMDEMLDFRVEYFPSKPFREEIKDNGPLNSAEDYTGQRYFLAYHLSSIPALRQDHYFGWTRYLDLSLGYEALHFKPGKVDDADLKQRLFLGVSFNFQTLIDETLWPKNGRAGAGVRSLRFFTEVVSVPFTTVDAVGVEREAPNN